MEMMQKWKLYAKWIEENVPANPMCLCTPVSLAMAGAFPELRIMSGSIVTESGATYEQHTWLLSEDGRLIVDPTEAQFGEPVVEYDAHLHDSSERTA